MTSPIATGGGGTLFELHVDTFFLALLLVRAMPPILTDCQVERIHLQAGHLGWNTDDLLLIGSRPDGGRRQLAIQIKRQFSISRTEKECKKAFADYWNDFKHNDSFNPENDQLALVTLLGTTALLSDFSNLLRCGRSSTDENDFAQRLKYVSKRARDYSGTIRDIIQDTGEDVTEVDHWRFLRVLNVISYDLATPTAGSEASIKSILASTTDDSDPLKCANETWRELLEVSSLGMPNAASYAREDLPESLRNRHSPIEDYGSIQTLRAHSQTTLDGISTKIANSVTIRRDSLVAGFLQSLDERQIVIVAGPSGSGKSALAKSALNALASDHLVLAFKAEEFSVIHIDQMLQRAQVNINAQRLFSILAGQGRVIILVENVERLLESAVRDAFSDLLKLSRSTPNINIILTCRSYSVDIVRSAFIDQTGLPCDIVTVPPLDDQELDEAIQALPILKAPVGNPKLKELLRSPYFLDIASRMDWSQKIDFPGDEREFRLKCWGDVVRNNAVAGSQLPQRREVAFEDLAIRRARALVPYISIEGIDVEAMDALKKDSLVSSPRETDLLAAPAHDVLEDWAILQWLDGLFYLHHNDAKFISDAIAESPAIRRGYRTWLAEILEIDPSQADSFVLSTLNVAPSWWIPSSNYIFAGRLGEFCVT